VTGRELRSLGEAPPLWWRTGPAGQCRPGQYTCAPEAVGDRDSSATARPTPMVRYAHDDHAAGHHRQAASSFTGFGKPHRPSSALPSVLPSSLEDRYSNFTNWSGFGTALKPGTSRLELGRMELSSLEDRPVVRLRPVRAGRVSRLTRDAGNAASRRSTSSRKVGAPPRLPPSTATSCSTSPRAGLRSAWKRRVQAPGVAGNRARPWLGPGCGARCRVPLGPEPQLRWGFRRRGPRRVASRWA